jgi:hypothetical protein
VRDVVALDEGFSALDVVGDLVDVGRERKCHTLFLNDDELAARMSSRSQRFRVDQPRGNVVAGSEDGGFEGTCIDARSRRRFFPLRFRGRFDFFADRIRPCSRFEVGFLFPSTSPRVTTTHLPATSTSQ